MALTKILRRSLGSSASTAKTVGGKGVRVPHRPDYHHYHSTFSPPYNKSTGRNAIITVVGLGIFAPWACSEFQQRKNGYKK